MEKSDISPKVQAIWKEMIGWRRHLHQFPELSFQEYETSTFVEEKLRSFGNIEVSRPTKTSVMGIVKGKTPGRIIALRADIDGLPIEEKNDLPYTSQNPGVMHACGHDGHTAILLATAKIISNMASEFSGEVRFLFQHAEELPPGGAVEMVKAGVMDGVEEVYGLHLTSNYPTCTFGVREGALTSATDRFDITVKGKGGHSAFPEICTDPIVMGAQIITALQHIVARQTAAVEPVVLSVCMVSAGQAYNIIPDVMQITGSTRTFDRKIREELPEKMEQIVRGITSSYGAGYEFLFSKGYASVMNDHDLTLKVEKLLTDHFGKDRVIHIGPLMPGEDFSAFSELCPGFFVELGTRNEEKGCDKPHHNRNYKLDEEALLYGVEFFTFLIQNRLSR